MPYMLEIIIKFRSLCVTQRYVIVTLCDREGPELDGGDCRIGRWDLEKKMDWKMR